MKMHLQSLCLILLIYTLLNGVSIAASHAKKGADELAFYHITSSTKIGKPGDLIRAKEIETDIPGAAAWKILYWSTTADNNTVPVSGIVIAPKHSPGGKTLRPVITWGHGTSGIATRCAPSLVKNPASEARFYYLPDSDSDIDYGIPALPEMIDAGYVIAATDYNGLGTEGIHHYLIGQTEARNMLDAAIAAQQIPETHAGGQVIAIGWSQGGQASIWAAQIPNYLHNKAVLLGAVSLAPVNALEEIKIMEKKTAAGEKLRPVSSAERIMGWYAMANVYPELKLTDVLTPMGMTYFSDAKKSQCSHQMGDTLSYFETYFGPVVRKDPINQKAWMTHYADNSLGTIKTTVPIAVYQGEDDLAVFPEATVAYVKESCDRGAIIAYKQYKGVDHIRLAEEAKADYLAWIADRFAKKPPLIDCA